MPKTIYVIGYPGSGVTWFARLISDALDCDVSNSFGQIPLAKQKGNNNKYEVVPDYLRLDSCTKRAQLFPGTSPKLSLKKSDKVIFVTRHPFDIITSVKFRYGFDSILETIEDMRDGVMMPKYQDFMRSWMYERGTINRINAFMYYEYLQINARNSLGKILNTIGVNSQRPPGDVCARNNIDVMRNRIISNPSLYSYSVDMQLKALRKGKTGDWVNHFSEKDVSAAISAFGDILVWLGFFNDDDKSIDDIEAYHKTILSKIQEK